jgi:uncharacterized membrane-anchored protein YhcB (DUF1043 family)
MKTNWIAISGIVIGAIILIRYLIKRNAKDEKELETFLNANDTPIENKEEEELNDIK